MTTEIASVRPATAEEWDSTWRGCAYSTFFHAREWAEIWQRYTRGKMRPDPRKIQFTDGKTAVLPLSSGTVCMGLMRRFHSSPGGTFGGWISTDELNVSHAESLSDYITTALGNVIWRLNPYDRLVLEAGAKNSARDETHVLDLSGGLSAVHAGLTKGHSSAVSKARRHGVTVRAATALDDWRTYYELYEHSVRRWGKNATSSYTWELFDEIYKLRSDNVKLWLAFYRDEIVAGALLFYASRHAVYWHGAALSAYFNLRPVHVLIYEAIKDACDSGYRWFDFNPSGGHEGVRAFKKHFGAAVRPCPVVAVDTPTVRALRCVSRFVQARAI